MVVEEVAANTQLTTAWQMPGWEGECGLHLLLRSLLLPHLCMCVSAQPSGVAPRAGARALAICREEKLLAP